MNKLLWFGAACAGLLLSVISENVFATDYVFTKIADTSGSSFLNFFEGSSHDAPAINDFGVVAFWAELDLGGEGIFTGDGGPITTIANTNNSIFTDFDDGVAISNQGIVAFHGFVSAVANSEGEGIYTGSGGPFITVTKDYILDASEPNPNPIDLGAPDINGSSIVAFWWTYENTNYFESIWKSYPDRNHDEIADTQGSCEFTSIGHAPTINDSGMLAYKAYNAEGSVIIAGTGCHPWNSTIVADTSGEFSSLWDPAINNDGKVAFRAIFDAGGEGVFVGDGELITTIADTSGPFSSLGFPAINDSGKVVFGAVLDAGGAGIFTGPDPSYDAVITLGEQLDGRTVRSLRTDTHSINNAGQIAFIAQFTDGSQGIYVATAASAVSVHYTVAASARDTGPIDGIFDEMLVPGPVAYNGFEEYRSALEFNVSGIEAGSTIKSATLALHHNYVDPQFERNIALYGYSGNGSVEFSDFTNGERLGSKDVSIGPNVVEYDVTSFVETLLDAGKEYAGFNLREENTTGALTVIFNLQSDSTQQPLLDITYLPATPEEQIIHLADSVMRLNIQSGLSNAMDSKLMNAYEALDDTNHNNDEAAENTLQAFINSVEAQRGKEITDAEADSLNAAAQKIIDNLSK